MAAIAFMCASAGTALAQNEAGGNAGGGQGGQGGQGGGRRGGNFDPAQWQQQRMERLRENMGVTDDAEWKVIQERAQKVSEAQMGVMAFRARGGGGRGPGGGGGGGGRGGFGQPSPEVEALRAAIDANAPADQIKTALQKYRDARKAKEAALEKTQAELKKVLSAKQEAIAVSQGYLD
ncbi:MAG: hypothetical protein H7Y43_18085 [Akkermansiaceae bacterium]|nr:hypothetical protein [Verrucomicrobiales bacterium]